MAQFRVAFIFEYGKTGWSEIWYRQASDPPSAASFTSAQIAKFMLIRNDQAMLRAVRVNDVAVPRSSFLQIYNATNVNLSNPVEGTGEPSQVAILAYVTTVTGGKRPLLLRGLGDLEIERDTAGNPIWNAAVLANLASYNNAAKLMGLQVQTLSPASNLNPDRPISQFAPVTGDTNSTLVTFSGLAMPDNGRVIFHKVSRNDLPGMQGVLPYVVMAPTQIKVPIIWRNAAPLLPGGASTLRLVQYTYSTVDQILPEDVRSKKTGRPSLLARGRRTGMRYRAR